MNLLKRAFVYTSNLVILIRISFAWNIFPLQTSEAPGNKNCIKWMQMDSPKLKVTFQPKGPGLELELGQKALEENIIVYLGTGCETKHTAVLLIHELGYLIRKPQKSIFVILPPAVAPDQQIMLM